MESKPPSNYLALSIITTIICCQIFGIIAIVYSSQVNSKYVAGDYAGAQKASDNAKLWNFLAIGISFFVFVLLFIFLGSGFFIALANGEL